MRKKVREGGRGRVGGTTSRRSDGDADGFIVNESDS